MAENENGGYTPKGRYERLLFSVYKSQGLSLGLKIASDAIALAVACAYLWLLYIVYSECGIWQLISLIAVTALPFFAVSLVRRVIAAARPYELYPFYDKPPRRGTAASFPSRHIFSAFIIGVLFCFFLLPVGIIILFLGVCLAIFRVLLGIHFIRDVIAGALIGALSGLVGYLVLFLSMV